MSSSKQDSWTTASAPGSSGLHSNGDQLGRLGPRQHSTYPTSNLNPQGSPGQASAPTLPPPSGSFYQPPQSSVHPLSNLTGRSQTSPQQSNISPPNPAQQYPSQLHQQSTHGSGYALPGLNQAIQHQPMHSTSSLDHPRERDAREREPRDRHRQQQEEAVQRDLEQREREHRGPAQIHSEALPIHQPVASSVGIAIHGPGGLLSGIGANAGAGPGPSASSLEAPLGPGVVFGRMMPGDGAPRTLQQISAQAPQSHSQSMPYPASAHNHPMPGGVAAGILQGQQPILNDALSYLDQVKVQFVDQPDVYNRFLDIMKDFKSQAIDTPGVIERVSTLFAGHPNLIQGFNTFLPFGYRIECGTGDDPNAIRVTTPMGTTVSSTTGLRPPSTNPLITGAIRPAMYDLLGRPPGGTWQQPPSHSSAAPQGMFSPEGRSIAPPMYGHAHSPDPNGQQDAQTQRKQSAAANAAAIIQHQLEQRGVSQLQSAVTVAAHGTPDRGAATQNVPNGGQTQVMGQVPGMNGVSGMGRQAAEQAVLEKRGPVEFNHAISYVNKIKNRFASQPEIYKQFLEILQTYQRESKPIQDVYAQVTHLFNSAPDLLEDFKQFLPESAAHAKEQAAAKQAAEDAAMLSNVRGETTYASAGQTNQQPPGHSQNSIRMPPVGNFAPPPSASKESKKRNRGTATQVPNAVAATPAAISVPDASQSSAGARLNPAQVGNSTKRAKLTHPKPTQPDVPVVLPSLIPALPEPLAPTVSVGATTEEIAFFDRVKKFIGNKQTMNEFLKLCNLFSMDLIDRNVLVAKVSSFIGANPELMSWFRRFVVYDGQDETIDNRPRPSTGKVTLSNCRGYGPSYRLLPRRERMKVCSGRDEMCYSVLNDEWASHPTWASEDSGFVAHRKNQYEEGLHRVEEERHDYDFNIEANLRTIQLLEPIAQQIAVMSADERASYALPPGLGGQSATIFQRVIKKVYDRERGQRVINDLFERPCAVVPLLLTRLKQKDEEWKAGQREWEKVWREQTQKMFWKSLDHMGIHAKVTDKKQFTMKTLVNEIQTKAEEQKRQREVPESQVPKHQFDYQFDDLEVVFDATRIILLFAEHTTTHTAADRQRLEFFLKEFIPRFFGCSQDRFEESVSNVSNRSPAEEEMEDVVPSAGVSASKGRKTVTGRRNDLRRGVLERGRNGKPVRPENDLLDSKESTPDVGSATEDDVNVGGDVIMETEAASDPNEDSWTQHPAAGAKPRSRPIAREIPPNEPFQREDYSLYCNAYLYCFLRLFQILYERLSQIKAHEKDVVEAVRRARLPKPAHDLRLIDKKPEDFFRNTGAGANYYQQVLEMCQEVIETQMETGQFEEVLRYFYLHCGWQLFAFEKLLGAIFRFALGAVSSDAKDKSADILQLFYKDREREESTHQAEINYRKQVEKMAKDGDVFRVVLNQLSAKTTIQLLRKDDATFDESSMTAEARWSYYTASFIKIEPTEGVPLDDAFHMPFLRRNLRSAKDLEDAEEDSTRGEPTAYEDNLELKICVNSYKILWEPQTSEFFVHESRKATNSNHHVELLKERRKAQFREKLVDSNAWAGNMSHEEAERLKARFRALVHDEETAAVVPAADAVSREDSDKMFTGT